MKLTEQDFVREIGWVLYSNKDTLPASVDIDDESPLDVLPTFVLEALVRDWNDPSIEQHFAADIVSHYNWTMFCVLEDTWEPEDSE